MASSSNPNSDDGDGDGPDRFRYYDGILRACETSPLPPAPPRFLTASTSSSSPSPAAQRHVHYNTPPSHAVTTSSSPSSAAAARRHLLFNTSPSRSPSPAIHGEPHAEARVLQLSNKASAPARARPAVPPGFSGKAAPPRWSRLGGGAREVYDAKSMPHSQPAPTLAEMTIAKYDPDARPPVVRGRQIAVNRSCFAYALPDGQVPVVHLETSARVQLAGHTQLIGMREDVEKQIRMAAAPVSIQGERSEIAINQDVEKLIQAHADVLWVRIQEEFAKCENAERDLVKQMTSVITNFVNEDLLSTLEIVLKKELSAAMSVVTQAVTSAFEKNTSSAIAESFQESCQSYFASSVIPASEKACKTMLEQLDGAVQKDMSEHYDAAKEQLEATQTALAPTLGNSTVKEVEAQLELKTKLDKMTSEQKYEEAFMMAIQRRDVSTVPWLCSQIDLHVLCCMEPLPLSQGLLLSLLEQLFGDISIERSQKVSWMIDAAVAIDPIDAVVAKHRPLIQIVHDVVARQSLLPPTTASERFNLRVLKHVLNSLLLSRK